MDGAPHKSAGSEKRHMDVPNTKPRMQIGCTQGARTTGDVAIAAIESLNYDGRGVAHVDGMAVFIEGALPGERVRFRYHNKRKNYATGRVQEIVSRSPARIEPPCPHFGVCGGCSLQHLRVEAQREAKQQILLENLEHIGHLRPDARLSPIAGPAWGYRRRARLGVRLVPKKGGVLVGFRERNRAYVTPLDACRVLDPRASALLPTLRDLVTHMSRPDRLPQIEVAAGDHTVALVFRHLEPLTEKDLSLLCAFGKNHDVQIHLQPGNPDSISLLWPEQATPLSYRLPDFDIEIQFRPTDFIQVNDKVNQQIVHRAVTLIEPQPDEQVLDLFCGLGNFTLPLARRAGGVLGIDVEAGLIDAARRNANLNNLTNAAFRQANLYDLQATDPPWGDFQFDKLLLDPPRSGALEVLKCLPPKGPERIVYISCYPATLARDGDYLVHVLGYRLEAAGTLDMFPQTSHVESMALFVKP